MRPPKDQTSTIRNASASPFLRMRAALVFAGLLGVSVCVGVLTASGQPQYNDDYYGDGYNDSGNPYPDQQGIDNPYDYYFHARLQSYGEWIPVQGFGAVWRPSVVQSWSPYALGYWASTQQGWMWVSYEPFGDIVYHYGNWGHLEGYGWCWFPGREWAPNHVDWTEWQDSIGWYPTPPRVTIQVRLDVRPSYDRYVWVSHRDFLDRDLSRRREMNPSRLWHGSMPPRDAPLSRVETPNVSVVERWTGRRAPQVQTQEVQRKTRLGEVRVVVPDQQTREEVRSKGAKVVRPWLAPKKQEQDKNKDKNKGKNKGKNKDKDAGKVNG
jgi:Family of unknown function (DUF6600)